MYLKGFKANLEDIGKCPPEVRKHLLNSLEGLEAYGFFDSIGVAVGESMLGQTMYDGVTAEELLISAAKYRAIIALLAEVKSFIESESERRS